MSMSRFDTYFLMKTEDVPAYVKEKGYMPQDAELSCKEIGDGNLNYVFRVVNGRDGKSVIVKQAGVQLRISADLHVSPDRNRIRAKYCSGSGSTRPTWCRKSSATIPPCAPA